MGDNSIREICTTIMTAGFPIVYGPDRKVVSSDRPDQFHIICSKSLQMAIEAQGGNAKSSNIWTSLLIRGVSAYAKKHGIKGKMNGLDFPGNGDQVPFAVSYSGELLFGLLANVPQISMFELEYILDHERGHVRDQGLLRREAPEVGLLFAKEKLTKEECLQQIIAYLDLLKKNLSEEDKEIFNALLKRVWGEIQHLSFSSMDEMSLVLPELLRYGEEVSDSRLQSAVFPPGRQLFSMYDPSDALLIVRQTLLIALLKEAGLWTPFLKQMGEKKQIATWIAEVHRDHVELFLIGIRSAKKYFSQQ